MPKIEEKKSYREALFNLLNDIQKITVKKDGDNTYHNSKYATLPNVLDTVMGAVAANGFTYYTTVFYEIIDSKLLVGIEAKLVYESNEITSRMALPTDGNPQKVGSIITYLRRYVLETMLNAKTAEDDDGNKASVTPVVPTPRQTATTKSVSTNNEVFTPGQIIEAFGIKYTYREGTYKSGPNAGKKYRTFIPQNAKSYKDWVYDYQSGFDEIVTEQDRTAEVIINPDEIPV